MAETPLELGLRAGGNWLHYTHEDDGYFLLEARRKRLRMKTYAEEGLAVATIALGGSQDWVHAKPIEGRLLSRRNVGPAHGGSAFVWRSSWAM
jgi:hypothetical protein